MNVLIGAILPLVTFLIFIGGMIYRVYVWKNLPSPKMTLFPAPESSGARFVELLKETFLFKSLFKGDKTLWFMGWAFHAMLALILIGHLRVFSAIPDRMLAAAGMSPEQIDTMSATTGGAAGLMILACLVVIMIRRMVVPRVREISSPDDFFALFLILAILLTGDSMRFLSHFDLKQTHDYFYGLVTLSSVQLPPNAWFLAHYLLVQLLIVYIPFSKILHFGGIFFTKSILQAH